MTGGSGFRRDVQGLRGIAVALVVLEHASDVVPGGYIGVDVFFVISGFVITRLMLAEFHSQGTVSLRDFYARRIRRLIPALAAVLIGTLLLSMVVLSPGMEQESAVWAAVSSLFFVANVRYLLQGGYFFLETDPFRHLWSLGVEEQFYAIYPLLLLCVFVASKRRGWNPSRVLGWTLFAVSAVSFVGASLLAVGELLPLATRLSFFGTPFRLWELMAGAMVAILLEKSARPIRRPVVLVAQSVGLFAIVWPAVAYDPFTLFPGVAAIPPVLGTALLIATGSESSPTRILTESRPLVYLGDISYGLYLWHWPLIVFSKRLFPDNSSALLVAVGVSVALADVQLRFLEDPIRRRNDVIGRKAVKLMSSMSGVVLVTCAALRAGSQWGWGVDRTAQFEKPPSLAVECGYSDGARPNSASCVAEGAGATRILLIGDSQAGALADAVITVARQIGASYRIAFGNSCPVHVRPNELRSDCSFIQSDFARLASEFEPTVTVVANASDLYVTRGGFGRPDARIRSADGSLPNNYQEALETWVTGVRQVLIEKWPSDAAVIYVQMVPVAPTQNPSVLRPASSTAAFPLRAGFDRNMIVQQEREELKELQNVTLLDPAEVLCGKGDCALVNSEGPIYADAYHLNTRGASLLAPTLRTLIEESIK